MIQRRLIAGIAVMLGTVVIAGGLIAVVSGRNGGGTVNRPPNRSSTTTTTTSSSAATGWTPVVPATTVPDDTPVQQQYDDGFETGLSSPRNRAMITRADSLELPPPAIGGGWPELQESDSPDDWATEFVTGLLDIDFADQKRHPVGSWLVAEEAPDLMPGIPAAFEERSLYVSLLEPGITGQPSPLPGASQWVADARREVRWSASDLEVQLEPEWQQMIDAGWQPADLRAAVEDVSGVLTVFEGTATTTRRFSMVVQVGSARWHDGYGTVLVSDWEESR